MKALFLMVVLSACGASFNDGGEGDDGPGGTSGPPDTRRQTVSDVHAEPGGEQVWLLHTAVLDKSSAQLGTSAFGVYRPADGTFDDVLDTTGTLGKKILFPPDHRVLLIARRGVVDDILVTIDTAALRPVHQRAYAGDLRDFQLSPSGRFLLATDADSKRHLFDTDRLVDQILETSSFDHVAWDPAGGDRLYVARSANGQGRIERLSLAGVDLAKPLPAPALVASVPASGPFVLSPDGRFLAIRGFVASAPAVVMVELATGRTTMAPDGTPAGFTRDGRFVIWSSDRGATFALQLAAPTTGATTAKLTTPFHSLPSTIALRDHDVVLANPNPFDDAGGPSLTNETRTGALIALPFALEATTWFERPGTSEVWIWSEETDSLLRLDLATHDVKSMLIGDSVDVLGDHELVVGTSAPAVYRYSLAARAQVGATLKLGNPSDRPAPYRLAPE